MSLSDLKKILTPPDLPLETSDLVGWAMVEKNLNTSLPKDYKDFIDTIAPKRYQPLSVL